MGHFFEERGKHVHCPFNIYLVDEKIQNWFEWDMFCERDKQVNTFDPMFMFNKCDEVLGTSDIS